MGTRLVTQGMGRKARAGSPMWTMASRDSAQPSQLGPPLPVSLRILSPGRLLIGPSCRATKTRPSLLCTHGGQVLSLSCSCLMVDWQLPDPPPTPWSTSSSPSFDTQGVQALDLSLTSALLQLSDWAPLSPTSPLGCHHYLSDSFLLFSPYSSLPFPESRCRPTFLPRV